MTISRRKFVASMLAVGAVAAGLIINIWRRTPRQPEQIATTQAASPQQEVTRTTQATSAPAARQITANDFSPEQTSIIETLVVLVNFSDRRGEKFDLGRYLDRIFGFEDPHTQLNAYYRENFYNQLELRQVRSPDFPEGYVEIEFEGSPQDYMFGWLIGMETEKIKQLDPDVVQQNILDAMAKVVQKHATIDYQDKFIIFVFNALGSEYGRGAAGALPTAGVDPIYDLFVGNAAQGDSQKFSDHTYFRIVDGTRVVGIVKGSGYTFGDYFRDRGYFNDDQFIKGIAIFAKDGPLSCASHDILHGLRRRSAYADPPEGRGRAVNCLYNLLLQSQWVVGSERGPFDRSINCSPFIGWWDPMGDHLHPRTDPKTPREFFSGHPHGMCAFTKLRMGMVPDRCIFVAEDDDMTVELSPLSSPSLPPKESEAEAIVVKVPVAPGVEKLAHVYLLLEYRRRVGSGPDDFHPDNFFIDPDYVEGDKTSDPGYNSSAPAESVYVNPPTRFVPDEGVLVYLVNEKMPEIAGDAKQEWWRFVLALLNPKGNEKRNDLNQAALDAGESMEVDFGNLYPDIGAPVKIRVTILQRSEDRCKLQITREYVG